MDRLTYTSKEIAKKLNISLNSLYALVRENKIPHLKIGKKNLYSKVAIDSWLIKGGAM